MDVEMTYTLGRCYMIQSLTYNKIFPHFLLYKILKLLFPLLTFLSLMPFLVLFYTPPCERSVTTNLH